MIAGYNVIDTGTGLDHHAGSLMSEDGWEWNQIALPV
jgi:hypothetical protein